MRIILAGPRGFCAGVNMAIESLETALRLYGTPIYVYHEIVHNRWVVERFRRLGVVFVDDLAEVPAGGAPALFGPRRLAGGPPRGGPAGPADHRRHLPAGDQGPPRGGPLRRGGLHDRPDRPRRARRGGGDDGRGPGGLPAGRKRPRTWTGWRSPTRRSWPT